MQTLLAILFASGLYNGSTKVITNAGLGLVVTFAPALLNRRYDVTVNPFLSLWIASAVFFHALGSFGFYGSVWWWDHMTHALSASLLAGAGYTVIRAVDLHSDEIYLPDKFMFVFILLTVIAFGVVWELFEFGLDIIADITQTSMPLAQHGLEDTMKDMMFNSLGALIVATLGQAYLSERSEEILEKIKASRKQIEEKIG
ncbi:MAG: hypothetical protein R6V35_00765 [Candidatus Nanohaloarchaea archaeon]